MIEYCTFQSIENTRLHSGEVPPVLGACKKKDVENVLFARSRRLFLRARAWHFITYRKVHLFCSEFEKTLGTSSSLCGPYLRFCLQGKGVEREHGNAFHLWPHLLRLMSGDYEIRGGGSAVVSKPEKGRTVSHPLFDWMHIK